MKKVLVLLTITIFVTSFWVPATANETFKLDEVLVGSSKESNKLQIDELRHTITPEDVGVTIYQSYENVTEGQHTLSVQEIRPDGTKGDKFTKTHMVTNEELEKGLSWSWYYTFKDDDLGDHPGKWRVLLYVDGTKKGETTFTVETSSNGEPDTSKADFSYDKDIFVDRVDGYMWQKMSNAERKAFALGMSYLMSRFSSIIDTPKLTISEAPTLAQTITYEYQKSGDWHKTIFGVLPSVPEELGSGTEQQAGPNTVAEYTGNGMKTTRPFSVNSNWEIQWKANGQIFQVYLMSEDGNMVDILANQQGAGSGSSYNPKAGTYYLEINAMGDWEIKIVEVN